MKRFFILLAAASILALSGSAAALDERVDGNETFVDDFFVGYTDIKAFPSGLPKFCSYDLSLFANLDGSGNFAVCSILERKTPFVPSCNAMRLEDDETTVNIDPDPLLSCYLLDSFGQVTEIVEMYVGEDNTLFGGSRLEGVIVDGDGTDYDYDLGSDI